MDISLKELTEALYKLDYRQESLYVIFERVVEVFQKLASESEKASPEKKEAWCTDCQEILQKLTALLQPSINRISISEELLVQAFDNPNYFNLDDWSKAQKGKDEITETFQKLLPLFIDRPTLENESTDTPPIEKKHPPLKPPTKSDWMKS